MRCWDASAKILRLGLRHHYPSDQSASAPVSLCARQLVEFAAQRSFKFPLDLSIVLNYLPDRRRSLYRSYTEFFKNLFVVAIERP